MKYSLTTYFTSFNLLYGNAALPKIDNFLNHRTTNGSWNDFQANDVAFFHDSF